MILVYLNYMSSIMSRIYHYYYFIKYVKKKIDGKNC